ncbi:MAG: aminotransferase class I/II-fold pyridoxal phosphate-dependent enzyme [Boseongicola sp.]|nr:MAG: aminotransferase class I/II-fold pyridoxal phosphate-dependent enzyme [Boseongicola sp.]
MTKRSGASFRAGWPTSISRPVVNPLQPSVVYASADPDELDRQYDGEEIGFTYAREGHPNAQVLGQMIDVMEGAESGVVTGSGMAAITVALLAVLKTGDHVIGADQLYGRSLRMMSEELPRLGMSTSLVDPSDLASVEKAIRPETRLILVETVSNPTLRVADIEGIIGLAKTHGILVAVDNTFATPRGLQPLGLGADIVIHSVTKLLAGHSDATLGYVAAQDEAVAERMSVLAATLGVTASPFDCWLAERGLYSFDLRYDRATANAAVLADVLAELPGVQRVYYPTRADHPDHNLAGSLLGGEGGHMVSFEIAGGRAAANAFISAAEGLNFAPTLGDIATTISHPVTSSHRSISDADRKAVGITEGFFRVSVGCEAPEILTSAFERAVKSAVGA